MVVINLLEPPWLSREATLSSRLQAIPFRRLGVG